MDSAQKKQRLSLTESKEDKEETRQVSVSPSFADSCVADLSQRSLPELDSVSDQSIPEPTISEAAVAEPTVSNSEPKDPGPVSRFRRFYRDFRSRQINPTGPPPPVIALSAQNFSGERFWTDIPYITDDERYPPAEYGEIPREEPLRERLEDHIKDLRERRDEYFAARKEMRAEKKEKAMGLKLKRIKARMSSLNET